MAIFFAFLMHSKTTDFLSANFMSTFVRSFDHLNSSFTLTVWHRIFQVIFGLTENFCFGNFTNTEW